MDRLLCQMIITDNLPLNIVRRKGFGALIAVGKTRPHSQNYLFMSTVDK
jgi:hypothetical protein